MLKYEGFVKEILDRAIMGAGRIILRSLKTTGNKNCFHEPRPKFFLQIIYDPFIFTKTSFSKTRSINSDRDSFMLIICQNVKIYSA